VKGACDIEVTTADAEADAIARDLRVDSIPSFAWAFKPREARMRVTHSERRICGSDRARGATGFRAMCTYSLKSAARAKGFDHRFSVADNWYLSPKNGIGLVEIHTYFGVFYV
jgi:hypothetical protein